MILKRWTKTQINSTGCKGDATSRCARRLARSCPLSGIFLSLALSLLGIAHMHVFLALDGGHDNTGGIQTTFQEPTDEWSSRRKLSPHASTTNHGLLKQGLMWIDVATFSEGISGWRVSLVELMRFARSINATIVEPCMTNGRLGSCFDHKIPVSEIFDLAGVMRQPSDGRRPPLMVSYDDYRKHRSTITSVNRKLRYSLCMNIILSEKTRCTQGISYAADINRTRFRSNIKYDREKWDTVVLQLEDYWRENSINRLTKLLGMKQIKVTHDDELLDFHPNHFRTVDSILRKSNITDGDFSVIHWRAEKPGMDFMGCAGYVVNAKHAMLEKRLGNNDKDRGSGSGSHPFVLLTSLNTDAGMMWAGSRMIANSKAHQALDFLMQEHGFLKMDELMKQSHDIQDPGMLAIYDLILAQKSKSFATCARDEGNGCDPQAIRSCEKCNHIGKFGRLALSLRKSSGVRDEDSSYGCWPGLNEESKHNGGASSQHLPSADRTLTRLPSFYRSTPLREAILDTWDEQFDQRRTTRHQTSEMKDGKRLFDLYEPEATCVSEVRFGSDDKYNAFGDGPKFVCGVDVIADKAKRSSSSDPGCLVYSIGSNNDVRFEKAVHTFMNGCEIHTFDPTLDKEPFVGGEYATFHPWGLGTDGGKEGQTMHGRENSGDRKSFETVIRELGHGGRTIDILKIDCQGCEYAAMPPLFDLIASGKIQVDQLLIELHDPKKSNSPQMLNDFFLGADKAKLRIFHKERNHWGCDGYRCVEYAFASESFLRAANGAAIFNEENDHVGDGVKGRLPSVNHRPISHEGVLDMLDKQFDQRRTTRHQTSEMKDGKRLFDLYEPEATCISEVRFGSDDNYNAFGDGPKFVCGQDVIADKAKRSSSSDPGCLVYSIGSNNDVRFEKAVHTFMNGCEIHTFDPTLDKEPFVGGEYATFHPWGLGTDGGKEGQTMHGRENAGARKSFETVTRELGHGGRTIDILKIDCQGCEYAAMPPLFDLIASGKIQVDQLLIELHDPKKSSKSPLFLNDFFLGADKAKLRIFHKERNHWGCDGYKCVEYAFVSESFLRAANGAVIFPDHGKD